MNHFKRLYIKLNGASNHRQFIFGKPKFKYNQNIKPKNIKISLDNFDLYNGLQIFYRKFDKSIISIYGYFIYKKYIFNLKSLKSLKIDVRIGLE